MPQKQHKGKPSFKPTFATLDAYDTGRPSPIVELWSHDSKSGILSLQCKTAIRDQRAFMYKVLSKVQDLLQALTTL